MRSLHERAVSCRRFRWLPGMRLVNVEADFRWRALWRQSRAARRAGLEWVPEQDGDVDWLIFESAVLDFEDPATLGCLLALVREAWGDPGAAVEPEQLRQIRPEIWAVIWFAMHRDEDFRGASEAEAMIVALECAP